MEKPESLVSYPLTPAQQLPMFARTYTIHKQVINIPISMIIDDTIDQALLSQSIETAVSRNDAFGLRYFRQDKEWRQYFTDRSVILLDPIDFTGRDEYEMEATFHKLSKQVMKIEKSPMAKICIFTSPDGKTGIFAVINHLIMDSWSIGIFFKDIMENYYAFRDQLPVPKPIFSYESALQKDLAYLSSDRYKQDVEYWTEVVANENAKCFHTSISGSQVLENHRKKVKDPEFRFASSFFLKTSARHEVLMMDETIVNKMKEFCQINNYPISLLIYFGLRTFYAKVNNRASRIGSMNMVARRSTLEEKKSGGSRVQTILMGSTDIDEKLTFKESLELILAEQNAHYRHADFSAMRVFEIENQLHGMKPGTNWRAFSYTFQPMTLDLGNGVKIATRWYSNGAAAQPIYITVMDGDGEGSLRFYYEYLVHHIQVEQIRKCHEFAIKVILTGINQPSITLGELIDLTF
ncbi:MAG: condensation domain-containing protein [Eubacteriales bacterium]|nr:condensation domain-containing protein [Eubacteriales bacterium]